MGAGDGGYVVYRARTEPHTFVIAIDSSADVLADGAWRAHRARLRNAAFLVEGIERLPSGLARCADEVTVHLPWGSLWRGLIGADAGVIGPLAALLRDGGELRLLISATARDGYRDVGCADLEALAPAYEGVGLALVESRIASAADVAASRSGWARRLGIGRTRSAIVARYRARRLIET